MRSLTHRYFNPLALLLIAAAALPVGCTQKSETRAKESTMPRARFKTTLGDFVVELDKAKAPVTVENFLSYVKEGFFNDTVVHRVEPAFVIQMGGYDASLRLKPTHPPITNEWQNGLKNNKGTLSMARTGDPNSATSQFFINLADNGNLDQPISGGAGYAVFGHIAEGADTVEKIRQAPTQPERRLGGMPCPNPAITIQSATLEKE